MKELIKKSLIVLCCFAPILGKADIFGSVIGTAETLGHIVVGETTITPSYKLKTWDLSDSYIDGDGDYEKDRLTVRYDKTTGYYFFYAVSDYYPFDPVSSHDPFPLPSPQIALWNEHCNTDTSTFSWVQTYSLLLSCTQDSSGLVPPSGPFDISFKTIGTALQSTCSDTNYGWSREFRKTVAIQPIGAATVVVGTPNFEFAYPFQCWAGSPYKY